MRKRLLFVDDEPLMRELYESFGTVLGYGHEIFTASGGAEALEKARTDRFDVIVSDLAMPGMDGLQFFSEVAVSFPECARIVISGFADTLKVAECLGVGHRFFSKPFNLGTLATLLQRICEYSYLLNTNRLRRIVCGRYALPTPPDTYLRLTELLNSEYADLDDVARIVEHDAGLSTKLLQIANSAQFGSRQKVITPLDAVQLLGLEAIRALTFGAHVFNFYEGSRFNQAFSKELWAHSLQVAIRARKIAEVEHLPTHARDECFLAGLLHDVGKLILACNAEDDYRQVLDLQRTSPPAQDAELTVFGATHAQVGAYLLALWGVPGSVIRAVEGHHFSAESSPQELGPALAVHVAQNLESSRESLLDYSILEQLGLTARIPAWKQALALA